MNTSKILVAAVLGLSASSLMPTASAQVILCGRRPITSLPTTITVPGSYYLQASLTGSAGTGGLTIDASDVTIDLNGAALSGVPGSLDGIVTTNNAERVVIYNGTVKDWGQEGIDVESAEIVRLFDLTVSGNGTDGSSHGVVIGASGNIKCVVSNENGGTGFRFGTGDRCQVTVSDCVANDNGSEGFLNIIGGGQTQSSSFSNCLARENGAEGFRLRFSTLRGCKASQNGGDGISLVRSTASSCSGLQNGGDGFDVFSTIMTNCDASENTAHGFNLDTLNSVRSSKASLNGGDGIHCERFRNLVDSNFMVLNTGFGVLSTDISNTIIRNSAVNNTAGGYSASGSRFGPIQSPNTATSPWANFE